MAKHEVVTARYRGFAIDSKQPRMITVNRGRNDWLNDVTIETTDQDAHNKRIVFCDISDKVITPSASGEKEDDLATRVDYGHMLLEHYEWGGLIANPVSVCAPRQQLPDTVGQWGYQDRRSSH